MMEAFNDRYKYAEIIVDSVTAERSGGSLLSSKDNPVFDTDTIKNIVGFKITEAEIPFTFYIINSKNNTFTLTEYFQVPVIVTLPVGNYTVSEYIGVGGVLAKALSAASLSLWVYTVELVPGTGKFVVYNQNLIVAPVPPFAAFTLSFGGSETSPADYIGFRPFSSSTSNLFSVTKGYGLVSPNVFNLTGPNYLTINSLKFGALISINAPNSNTPSICRIAVTALPGQVNFFKDPAPAHYFNLENLRSLDEFDLYLSLGSSTSPLELNGASFTLKMVLFFENANYRDSY